MSLLLDWSHLGCGFLIPLFVYAFGVSSPGATNVLTLHRRLCELFEEKQHLVQTMKKTSKTGDQEGKMIL